MLLDLENENNNMGDNTTGNTSWLSRSLRSDREEHRQRGEKVKTGT